MLKKAVFCLCMTIIVLLACQSAYAADVNMYLHFYTFDGVAIGEFGCEDRVAFRLRIAKDGTLPVISMQKGNVGTIIAPDITNGMFMLRITGAGNE